MKSRVLAKLGGVLMVALGALVPMESKAENATYLECKSSILRREVVKTHLLSYNKETGKFYKEREAKDSREPLMLSIYINKDSNTGSINGVKGELNLEPQKIYLKPPEKRRGEWESISIDRKNLNFRYFSNYPLPEVFPGVKNDYQVEAEGICKKAVAAKNKI